MLETWFSIKNNHFLELSAENLMASAKILETSEKTQ